MTTYKFQFTIGDSSGDGHGQIQVFSLQGNYPFADIKAAYARSKILTGVSFADEVCSAYEETKIDDEVFSKLAKFPGLELDRDSYVYPEEYVGLFIWFCRLSLPDLHLELVEGDEDLSDCDSSYFGYGLLGL